MFEKMLYRVWWWLMSEIPTVDGLHLEVISNYHWHWLSITGSFKIYIYKCLLCGKKKKKRNILALLYFKDYQTYSMHTHQSPQTS